MIEINYDSFPFMFGILNVTNYKYIKVDSYFDIEMNQRKLEKVFN